MFLQRNINLSPQQCVNIHIFIIFYPQKVYKHPTEKLFFWNISQMGFVVSHNVVVIVNGFKTAYADDLRSDCSNAYLKRVL